MHPQDLRRAGRGARPRRSSRRRRSAGSTTRSTSSATPSRRVPGVEYLRTDNDSGDNGADADRLRPVRRHRRHHAGHAQPADAGRQRDQHARRRQHASSSTPTRRARRIAAEGVRRFNKAIREAIGIDDLLTIIDPPTLESAAALFDHRGVRLLVRHRRPRRRRGRPWRASKRAIVAGPGNPPVVVDATACLDNAARSIIAGARVRQQPALHRREAGLRRRRHLRRADGRGRPGTAASGSTPGQIEALTKAAFTKGDDGKLHVNKDLIGQDAAVLGRARRASTVPDGHADPLRRDGRAEHPFVEHEQMMPFVPFVRVPNVDGRSRWRRSSEHGYGHTAILHSRDTSVMIARWAR